jgi:hypothetical protein
MLVQLFITSPCGRQSGYRYFDFSCHCHFIIASFTPWKKVFPVGNEPDPKGPYSLLSCILIQVGFKVFTAMAQLVEVLRYKPKGCGFDSRWWHWKFWLIQSFRPHYGSGVDSASKWNEYKEYLLGVKAAGAYGW